MVYVADKSVSVTHFFFVQHENAVLA
jgi:hypothetical protein